MSFQQYDHLLYASLSRTKGRLVLNKIFMKCFSMLMSQLCNSHTCTVVIVRFWRSVELGKKSCHFMIMVFPCCDLLVVISGHPFLSLLAVFGLTEKACPYDGSIFPCTYQPPSLVFLCLFFGS